MSTEDVSDVGQSALPPIGHVDLACAWVNKRVSLTSVDEKVEDLVLRRSVGHELLHRVLLGVSAESFSDPLGELLRFDPFLLLRADLYGLNDVGRLLLLLGHIDIRVAWRRKAARVLALH